ncbi:MAG: ABC transporter ATP-binding protein [Ruminococcaceae bacterium]|nr:ABC transporter ATP-binding protein [Oscillospiraceae bacterium]
MLKIKDLTVKYGKKTVLDNVNITLNKNRFTAILGKNGSGKSTVVSCISKQTEYTGEILLDGKDIQLIKNKKYSQMISVLPQKLEYPPITVEELVGFGRNPYTSFDGRLSDEDKKEIADALKATAMDDLSQRLITTLSGGERQKAYLAMIIAQQTPTVLLDEPTTHMDICAQDEFISLITKLKQNGKTPIVIMHDLALAVKHADDIVIIEKGNCIFNGTKEECLNEKAIEKTFSVKRIDAENEIFFSAQ